MPDNITAIDATTHRYIEENPNLVDMVFNGNPMARLLKEGVKKDFNGGRLIAQDLWYRPLKGGGYAKGQDFNISEVQTEQQLQFNPKYVYVDVTLTKEDLQVLNRGPAQAVSLIQSRTQEAFKQMGVFMDIGAYLQGQQGSYTRNVNGLTEAFSDGLAASWDGTTYTTYGGLTRATYSPALNSPAPVNVNGTLEVTTLEELFTQTVRGGSAEMAPTDIVTTPKGYSYLKEKFLAQQIFQNTQEGRFGFTSMKYDVANVMRDWYAPGTYISGTGDPTAVEYIQSTTNGEVTQYPTVTGETLWIVNARNPYLNAYICTDPEYSIGFTGFKPAQGNTKIVGQVLLAWNITASPRQGAAMYGITG